MPEDLAASERMVEDWNRTIQQRVVRYQAMADRVEELSVTERSADRVVEVTVSARGVLTGLDIAENVNGRRMGEVAALVMATMQRAQARIPELLEEVMAETIGTTDQTANKILADARDQFPQFVEEEQAERPRHLRIGANEEDEQPSSPPPRRRARDHGEDDDFGGSILS
ncbi:YbaB/EbfC family nucleoid-associated protein [Actinokineospora enzanensis]|uniref:YbaB/EbfC family nucleoid-associated protein n=1 Tax=Actinokineospora enzanensis TaxID=155975 RepID=UPI0003A1335C|nr:YbaB/EbfC family nucleoid-associated protein [Actinokineospora enzanensis]